jgi:hypothetical protein
MVKRSVPGVGGGRVANMASALKKMRQQDPMAWGKNPFDEVLEWIKNGEVDEPLS